MGRKDGVIKAFTLTSCLSAQPGPFCRGCLGRVEQYLPYAARTLRRCYACKTMWLDDFVRAQAPPPGKGSTDCRAETETVPVLSCSGGWKPARRFSESRMRSRRSTPRRSPNRSRNGARAAAGAVGSGAPSATMLRRRSGQRWSPSRNPIGAGLLGPARRFRKARRPPAGDVPLTPGNRRPYRRRRRIASRIRPRRATHYLEYLATCRQGSRRPLNRRSTSVQAALHRLGDARLLAFGRREGRRFAVLVFTHRACLHPSEQGEDVPA
jgi:hypothetical protein